MIFIRPNENKIKLNLLQNKYAYEFKQSSLKIIEPNIFEETNTVPEYRLHTFILYYPT